MKWCTARNSLLAAVAGLALLLSGCGSSSANVVAVAVSPTSFDVLTGQVENFTATVTGSTTLTVQWTCSYSYTPLATSSNPTPKAVTGTCTSGMSLNGGNIGSWVTSNTNGSNVLTFTAPALSSYPVPSPTLTFTATADADHSKTGTATVTLDSGIRVAITPTTATVPVGLNPAQTASFSVSFTNSAPVNQQFKLVQPNGGNTSNTLDQTANPQADTCTVSSPTTSNPGCGSIDNNGIYTAPIALPTNTVPSGSTTTSPTTVYVVAWSSADPTQYQTATITLVNATTNPPNYTGLYPPTIAAGGLLQDVFLNAKNLLNTTQINFVGPTAASNLNASSGTLLPTTQWFTIPISTSYCTPSAAGVTPVVTCDASLVTRVRLLTAQLALASPDANHPAWIMISNLPGSQTATAPCIVVPGAAASTTAIACPLQLVNASPGLVASVPDVFPQVSTSGTFSIGVDGGYFGSLGSLVNLTFNGQAPLGNSGASASRQVTGTQSNVQLPPPGLYEVSVNSNILQGAPPMFTTATLNAAVQPNFATFTPNTLGSSSQCLDPTSTAGNPVPLSASYPSCVSLGTGNAAPSDMALDSVKGYAVIAEQGTGSMQFVNLTGTSPALLGSAISVGSGGTTSQPTSVALDTQINLTVNGSSGGDLLAVLASGDNQLYLYGVSPPANGFAVTYLSKSINLSLATLLGLSSSATGLGTPFSVGIDPTTHLGVVAYSNSALGSNIGFIVDVNPNLDGSDTHTCFLSGQVPPCVITPVSVNTGQFPKVVMQPNVPLAYVTPGGGIGTTSVVDLLQQGKSSQIAPYVSGGTSGAVRTAGITKIITLTPHGIDPAMGGTVIISGLTPGVSGSNFNGTFPVLSVTDAYSFTYAQTGQPDDTATNVSTNSSGAGLGTVEYGVPYYSFSTTTSASGAAINPITRTFAYADYNSTTAQIGFISTLDQTLTTLTLTLGSCYNNCTPSPSGAPESGFRSVAWDPFVDVLVAYNPSVNTNPTFNGNDISLINPGGPAPGGSSNPPYRIIAAIPTGQVGTGSYTPTGASSAVTVYGPMTYDPKSKYVLVANAGSNTLSFMSLDPSGSFQKVHIQDLQLADQIPAYGVPVAQPALGSLASATTCSLTNPTMPCMPQAVRVGQAANLRVLGQGFLSGGGSPVVRLDGQIVLTPSAVTDTEIDVTVPATALFAPHDYALDVQTSAGGNTSNSIELHVVGILDLSTACTPTSSFPQGPEGVAVDQSRHVAYVTNYACNSVSVIAINPSGYVKSDGTIASYGAILATIGVGPNPIGIDVIPRLGYAVVANSGATPYGTATILNVSTPDNPTVVPIVTTTTSGSTTTTTTSNSVTVGLSPLGVKIDQDRALAFVANNGSNTLSSIDLTVLLPGAVTSTTPTATTVALSGPPTAIAIDPNRAEAVVTNLQNSGTTTVTGGIDVVTLSGTVPVKSSTTSISSLSASVTGIVYDPGDPNNSTSTTTGVFYATSTQANAIYSFDPDTGSTQTIRVGINPYSLGYNYQTGTLLTINSTSNSSSVVDVQNFQTRQTLGISSMSQFAIDVDNFTNTAVIADQNNNRVVFLAMPR